MEKKNTIKKWQTFYKNKGVSNDIADKYLRYIAPILEKEVPIIFDFTHLALLLGRQPSYLASVINSPQAHYREFKLKKRNGGYRMISVPYPALLEMQYWIYDNILTNLQVSASAHGFAKKKSTITNAQYHLNQKHLLKIDLKDFFPSIKIAKVIKVFKKIGYTTEVSFYLASICCLEKVLPQGAPTSPCLSNLIFRDLDTRLIKFSKSLNLKYTRYADDLTFSGSNIPSLFIKYISDIVESEDFTINNPKTRLYKNKGKRIVTGISIASNTLKVPREYKRKVKLEIHYIQKFGLKSHVSKMKIKNPFYLDSLLGKLYYWKNIEPQSNYVKDKIHFLKKLKKETK